MGEAEIINELKRLSNVITSLDAMIAQQVITNTNLTNSITELQNQVAQQTITNTNLVNSITTLTTITGQLVTVNTRALNDTDIAHVPVPYNLTPYANAGAVLDNAQASFDLSATTPVNWGAGNSCIIYSVALTLVSGANEWNTLWGDGFRVLMLVLGGNYYYRENFPAFDPKSRPHYHTAFTAYAWDKTWRFETGIILTAAQTFRLVIHNDTGQDLTVQLNIAGIPIAL